MKSEHRHELRTSEVDKLVSRFGSFFEANGKVVLIGLITGCLVLAAVVVYSSRVRGEREEGWTRFMAAASADKLAEVADEFDGTKVGAWARLSEANQYLQQGIQLSFTDRKAAISDLDQAKKAFQQLVNDKSAPPLVRERALIGLARYYETSSDGTTDQAVEAYSRFVSEFPESSYAEFAKQRTDALKTGAAQEFYAWFQKQNPKPEDRKKPEDGVPSKEIPDFTLPPEQPASETSKGPASTNESAAEDSPPPPPLPEEQKAGDLPSKAGEAAAGAKTDGDAPAPATQPQ